MHNMRTDNKKEKKTVKKKSQTKQPIKVDWSEVDKYLVGGAKGTEVAAALGIHYDTLAARCKDEQGMLFSEYTAKKRQKGGLMLHVKQFQIAMGGNVSMLIWLGKNRLGQSDKEDINQTVKSEIKIVNYGDTKDPKPYSS